MFARIYEKWFIGNDIVVFQKMVKVEANASVSFRIPHILRM